MKETYAPKVYRIDLRHTRLVPVRHEFKYQTTFYAFDLDSPPRNVAGFSWNGFNMLSFCEADYLRRDGGPLSAQVRTFLAEARLERFGHRIVLVTNLRVFGYVFNPVSFYFCYDVNGKLGALLSEVNNTFGEKHLYLCEAESAGARFQSTQPKVFHVSPFIERNGEYQFRFADLAHDLDVAIDLFQEKKPLICTRMKALEARPFTGQSLIWSLFATGFAGAKTFPRILWQAFLLSSVRRVKSINRPEPESAFTLRKRAPSFMQRLALSTISTFLNKLRSGRLIVELPNGEERAFGEVHQASLEARVVIKNYRALTRVFWSGDIGFGDGYVSNDWDSPDLGAVLRVLTLNMDTVDDRFLPSTWLGRIKNIGAHLLRRNSVRNSRKNIFCHYDQSNDLFRSFLDPSMTYSCAIFKEEAQTLEEAQAEKIRNIIRRADIRASDHVLEIGCGWGSFAITAATEVGCRVTAITLSEEQKREVESRIEKLGLGERIKVELSDYRSLQGQFDKIVSIEMIEAVGHEYLPTFFEVCDRLLKPNGKVVLQAITMPESRYDWYRWGCDWIQRRVFPGGNCPSIEAMQSAARKATKLRNTSCESIGVHYTRTLKEWRERFQFSFDRIRPLGFDDRFRRLWIYYLTYCEEGFRCRVLDTVHLVFEREEMKLLKEANGESPVECSFC